MKTSDFDYDLPESFIAQKPVEPRGSSRLMILNRLKGTIRHDIFRNIGEYLKPGDLMVLNQTRVIPARLRARKATGGEVEILLLRKEDELTWETLVGGRGMLKGRAVTLQDGLKAEIVEVLDGSRRRVRFFEPVENHLANDGQVPLPPYIHEKLEDPERYQTVYAHVPGSAAAPTAGLHFTEPLLQKLKAAGVNLAYITLHVGLDTFAPVTEEAPANHKIHSEWCELSPLVAKQINETREKCGRIVAVGTTSVRTLESAATLASRTKTGTTVHANSLVQAFAGPTSLYILPGYEFKVVDAMITNFHLPKSTLLMLVSAFTSRETILNAYEAAKLEGYRFFSFGDAMFIA